MRWRTVRDEQFSQHCQQILAGQFPYLWSGKALPLDCIDDRQNAELTLDLPPFEWPIFDFRSGHE